MSSQWGFILKVMILSALISVAIKQAGSLGLTIQGNQNAIALTIVCLPTVIMGILLSFRAFQGRGVNQ